MTRNVDIFRAYHASSTGRKFLIVLTLLRTRINPYGYLPTDSRGFVVLHVVAHTRISIFLSNSNLFLLHRNHQFSEQSKSHRNTGIITKQSTQIYVPGSGVLTSARRSFLFYPLTLEATPPIASVLRSPTDLADSSASAHLCSLRLLLPRRRCSPSQPPAGVVVQQSRQIVVPVRAMHRCRNRLHLSPDTCRPDNSLSLVLLFSAK